MDKGIFDDKYFREMKKSTFKYPPTQTFPIVIPFKINALL